MSAPAATDYVILSGKPGIFHTEIGADTRAVEFYDYVFHGRVKARFVIAVLERETRILVIDEGQPPTVSHVPSKLLKRYPSIAEARRELAHLMRPELPGTQLLRTDV